MKFCFMCFHVLDTIIYLFCVPKYCPKPYETSSFAPSILWIWSYFQTCIKNRKDKYTVNLAQVKLSYMYVGSLYMASFILFYCFFFFWPLYINQNLTKSKLFHQSWIIVTFARLTVYKYQVKWLYHFNNAETFSINRAISIGCSNRVYYSF